VRDAIAAAGLARQALHAAVLGFVHPVTASACASRPPARRHERAGRALDLELGPA
jgi:23S rRNA pseudouridine1911/1915/1917 synthase